MIIHKMKLKRCADARRGRHDTFRCLLDICHHCGAVRTQQLTEDVYGFLHSAKDAQFFTVLLQPCSDYPQSLKQADAAVEKLAGTGIKFIATMEIGSTKNDGIFWKEYFQEIPVQRGQCLLPHKHYRPCATATVVTAGRPVCAAPRCHPQCIAGWFRSSDARPAAARRANCSRLDARCARSA